MSEDGKERMSKLPVLIAEKRIKVLEKDGFVFIRQKGSHRFYEKLLDGVRFTGRLTGAWSVPHPNAEVI